MMTHITFCDPNTEHTFRSDEDLNLIISRVTVGTPLPRSNLLIVPGADGAIDLSELDGRVRYDDRIITIEAGKATRSRYELESALRNAIHGKRLQVTISRDPDWHYIGRCSVGDCTYECGILKVVISITASPYKLKNELTVVERALTANYTTIQLPNARMPVVPTFTVGQATVLKVGETEYGIAAGEYRNYDIELPPGGCSIEAKTNGDAGTIRISYREGSL